MALGLGLVEEALGREPAGSLKQRCASAIRSMGDL